MREVDEKQEISLLWPNKIKWLKRIKKQRISILECGSTWIVRRLMELDTPHFNFFLENLVTIPVSVLF